MIYTTNKVNFYDRGDNSVIIYPIDFNIALNKSSQKIYEEFYNISHCKKIETLNKNFKIKVQAGNDIYHDEIYIELNDIWYSIFNLDTRYLFHLILNNTPADGIINDVQFAFDNNNVTHAIAVTSNMREFVEAKTGARIKYSSEVTTKSKRRIVGHQYYENGDTYVVLAEINYKGISSAVQGYLITKDLTADETTVSAVFQKRLFKSQVLPGINDRDKICLLLNPTSALDCGEIIKYDCKSYKDDFIIPQIYNHSVELFNNKSKYINWDLNYIADICTVIDRIDFSSNTQSVNYMMADDVKSLFKNTIVSELTNRFYLQTCSGTGMPDDEQIKLFQETANVELKQFVEKNKELFNLKDLRPGWKCAANNAIWSDFDLYEKYSKLDRNLKSFNKILDRSSTNDITTLLKIEDLIKDAELREVLIDIIKTAEEFGGYNTISYSRSKIKGSKTTIIKVTVDYDNIKKYFNNNVPTSIKTAILEENFTELTVVYTILSDGTSNLI